jgi:general secretion pathway protein N
MEYPTSGRTALIAASSAGSSTVLWNWAIAGVCGGLLSALVVFAPARWLGHWIHGASGQRLSFVAPLGTVWRGSSQLMLSGSEGSTDAAMLPGLFTWRFLLGWGGLSVNIQADCCARKALHLSLAPNGWSAVKVSISDSQTQWPAALLTGLGTPWNTLRPEGQLLIMTQGFYVEWADGRPSLYGRIQVDANEMSSSLSTLQPIGSYRVILKGGATPTLKLDTLQGSLQLTGEGQWINQRFQFTGVASALPDRIDALSNLLNIIGRRNGARAIIKLG